MSKVRTFFRELLGIDGRTVGQTEEKRDKVIKKEKQDSTTGDLSSILGDSGQTNHGKQWTTTDSNENNSYSSYGDDGSDGGSDGGGDGGGD